MKQRLETVEGLGMRLGAVVTAAGLSSRMGDFKPLLPYNGTTMIRFLIGRLKAAGAAPVVVVIGYRKEELEEHLADMDVLLVENSRYAQTEMFDSIKLGFQRLEGLCERAAFVPVDVPELSNELLDRVFHAEGRIVRPVYHGRPGHPVVIDAGLIPDICAYTGHRGLRGALESLACGIVEVEAENDGIYNDIDTMEDYRRLVQEAEARSLYIVRHGEVEFPDGEKRCIGRTDLPLSERGRRQARKLWEYFRDKDIEAVYASPLARALETARLAMGDDYEIRVRAGLTELDMGSWENQPLNSLHKRLEDEAPGGERRSSALNRFSETVNQIMEETSGNVVIVSHAGVICTYLSERLNTPLETSRGLRQPYCGLNIFEVRTGSSPKLLEYGLRANQTPDETEIRELFQRRGTPEPVIRHCKAVAAEALRIAGALNGKGMQMDEGLIWAAALLHDVERLQNGHDRRGSELLMRQGYPQVAHVIRQHHELDRIMLDEAAVVFYADKRYMGEQRVTLRKRFADSAKRHKMDQEAQRAHERRFCQVQAIEAQLEEILGAGALEEL